MIRLLRAGDLRSGARQFVDTIAFGPGAWDKLPANRQETFINNAPTWLDEMQDPNNLIVDLDALGRFERPTLLSHGDRSPPFFPAVVDTLARAMPRAERHVFTGAAHVPHISHPRDFVDVVSRFVLSS